MNFRWIKEKSLEAHEAALDKENTTILQYTLHDTLYSIFGDSFSLVLDALSFDLLYSMIDCPRVVIGKITHLN